MPNPKIQVIVSEKLKGDLEEAAEARDMTLSAYCAEQLGLMHAYSWVLIRAPREVVSKLRSLIGR